MARFTLSIDTDNAAFGEEGEARRAEIARILRDVAVTMERDPWEHGSVFDSNGNRVGKFGYFK